MISHLDNLRALFKAKVLVSNVLPVLTGFCLALFFTNSSFTSHWFTLILTLLGSTFVIAGALVFNNWYEVDLDAKMLRTQHRPTVTGAISLRTILIMSLSISAVGFIMMLFTTIEAFIYAAIGWFTYVFLYTLWSKRKYTFNTIIGSVSGAVTPFIGWAAIDSSFHIVPFTLLLILFIWQMPHTYAIAMKRHDEYKAAGVPMLPVVYGFKHTKRQIVIYIACLLPLPFLLTSLGPAIVAITLVLSIGWLILAIRGFYAQDDVKWAQQLFIYSIYYLMFIFIMLIVVTWII